VTGRPGRARSARLAVRVLLVLPLASAGLLLGSGVAVAHGSGGPGPEMHLPRIVALDPSVPGLSVTVIEGGMRLRVDNGTGETVDVRPAAVGARADEPVIAPGATARWADARVRAAAADPVPAEGRRAWAVPLLVGDQLVLVRGEQTWPAPPASAPWWLATLLAAVLAAAVGRRAVSRPGWAPALALLTLTVAGAHVVHVLGSALLVEDRPALGAVLGTAGPAVLGWAIAALGCGLTLAHRAYGPLLCALSGALFALFSVFGGDAFSSPVLPFAWAPDLDRLTLVLTLGGGLGLFLTGLAALARDPAATPVAASGHEGNTRPAD
jgi:hypothetical protein